MACGLLTKNLKALPAHQAFAGAYEKLQKAKRDNA